MNIIGCNSAGLLNKVESLKRNIQVFQPGVIFIQESKTKRKNKVKLGNYVIFEKIRKDCGGGGLLTAVHKNLEPISVGEDTDEEVLVVEAKLANRKVRLINAYGPQETETEDKKKSFFNKMDEEIKGAKIAGTMVCVELDANSKLGSELNPGDPHPQSKNGKHLENLVIENDLIVVNSLDICEGNITRSRKTINRDEKSILDYFLVCRSFLSFIRKMIIDEEQKYSLTKFSTKKGVKSVKKSDHNLLILELNLRWSSLYRPPRIEIHNFKKIEDFKKFQSMTENNEELLSVFEKYDDLNLACSKWLNVLNGVIKKCFKKIRISNVKNSEGLDQLFSKKETIKQKIIDAENGDNLDVLMNLENEYEEIIDEIANVCSKKNKETVEEYFGKKDDNEPHNQLKTWALKKKLAPKNCPEAPSAKINEEGELVTEQKELEKLYLKTYVERLKPNPISEDMKEISELRSLLFDLRLDMCGNRTSPEWSMDDLEIVLKRLKNNKARDAHGHIYELFKFGGKNLKLSLLKMFNLIKKNKIYPEIFQPSNISSLYKSKGRKDDLNSDRGVFNVVKLRSLLDKLSYNDNYDNIDQNMSCSNIGARKNRNIRDHLFVINGILNDVNKNKKNENIDILITDIRKCFDKMSYKETGNDLFDAGVNNDHFNLMANSNKKCQVAVKTPWVSLTEMVELSEIEMQGTENLSTLRRK